jgi:hypothetical protein
MVRMKRPNKLDPSHARQSVCTVAVSTLDEVASPGTSPQAYLCPFCPTSPLHDRGVTSLKTLISLVRPAGLEPATERL